MLEGRIEQRAISPSAVRRLFAARGLDRQTLRSGSDSKQRLRWEAERPGALWHGDVCHGAHILINGEKKPVRVHGLLDDCSRFVVGLEDEHYHRTPHGGLTDALSILHEAAGSSLRDTDRIATAALRTAARRKKKIVERDVLSRILQAEAEDRA